MRFHLLPIVAAFLALAGCAVDQPEKRFDLASADYRAWSLGPSQIELLALSVPPDDRALLKWARPVRIGLVGDPGEVHRDAIANAFKGFPNIEITFGAAESDVAIFIGSANRATITDYVRARHPALIAYLSDDRAVDSALRMAGNASCFSLAEIRDGKIDSAAIFTDGYGQTRTGQCILNQVLSAFGAMGSSHVIKSERGRLTVLTADYPRYEDRFRALRQFYGEAIPSGVVVRRQAG